MKRLTDCFNNEALKAGMQRVQGKMAQDTELCDLANRLNHLLYDDDNAEGFLGLLGGNAGMLSYKLKGDAGCYIMCVFDSGFNRLLDIYVRRGIPQTVLQETLSEFDVSADEYYAEHRQVGVGDSSWILNHMQGKLFRLGRLQYIVNKKFAYNSYVFRNSTGETLAVAKDGVCVDAEGFVTRGEPAFTTNFIKTDNTVTANRVDKKGNILRATIEIPLNEYQCVLEPGDDALNVHIPSGGKLDIEQCRQSLDDAVAFGRKHFPEYNYKTFTLRSWLLSEEVKELLDNNANIIRFSDMFSRAAGIRTSSRQQVYNWIFGHGSNFNDYLNHEAKTTLQRGAHRLLDEDRWFITRTGFIII